MDSVIQQFIIFCLESYKVKKGVSGAQVLADFEKYDVFSFLMEGFEVLHTQSQEYILTDIEDYIHHKQQ